MLRGSPLERALAARLVRGMNAELHGADHLPRTGGALVVGNHALFGVDSFALGALLVLETGRSPRWLAERMFFKTRPSARLLHFVGAVEGSRAGAVELLRAGEVVVVYPGGIDESFKLASERYELRWSDRAGFAHVALEAGVPVVPVAATGIDEIFEVERRESVVGRTLWGSARYDMPVLRSYLPARPKLDYWIQPAIPASGTAIELREATHRSLETVLRPYRERLRGEAT